jgi:histidinol-phosphate aminotransferase
MFTNKLFRNAERYVIPKNEPGYINLSVIQNYSDAAPGLEGANLYPSRGDNFEELYDHVCQYYEVPRTRLMVTHGSGAGLLLILRTFCDTNSRILIPVPNYPGFIHDAYLVSANITLFRFDNSPSDYKNFCAEVEEHDFVYLSTPNIPLGYEIDSEFIQVVKQNPSKLFVIDEAYFEYGVCPSFAKHTNLENLIVTRTFSKAFGLAGARIGFIIAHEDRLLDLSVGYCTKEVTDHGVNLANRAMRNLDHYVKTIQQSKKEWRNFFVSLEEVITVYNPIIYDFHVGNAPFFLLYTKHPEYVCDMFKRNMILVRDKSKDIGQGVIRVALGNRQINTMVLNTIKKINAMSRYDNIYLDIDNTIRKSRTSAPLDGVAFLINALMQKSNVIFVTNSLQSQTEIQTYLTTHRIGYTDVICPFDFELADDAKRNGYFVRDDKLYVIKFPNITQELFDLIHRYGIVHIIEEHDTESTGELGYTPNYEIPFIGEFRTLILRYCPNVEFKVIGKSNLLLPKKRSESSIMIGDSPDDFAFARLNRMYFYHVEYGEVLGVLKKIISFSC